MLLEKSRSVNGLSSQFMHDSILERTLQIADSFLIRVHRTTLVERDRITVTFNPQWARATSLGEVTRRGEKPSVSLPPIGETTTNWISCSVTRESGMYVGSRKLARRQAGWRDLRLAHVCHSRGWKFMPANRSRHPTKLITTLGSRAQEGSCPCFAEIPAYVTFTGISSFLFPPRFAETAEMCPRSKVAIDSRTGRVSPAFAPR